jgi:hypothetical protein
MVMEETRWLIVGIEGETGIEWKEMVNCLRELLLLFWVEE